MVSAIEVCLGSSAAVPVRPWLSTPAGSGWYVMRRTVLGLVGRFEVEAMLTASVVFTVEGHIGSVQRGS